MMQRHLGAAIVLAVLTGCGGGGGGTGGGALPQTTNPSQPSSSGPLPEPPVVLPKSGVATVQLTSQIDPATGFPEFVYKGERNTMPTIDVAPGDTIVVDVANDLPSSGGRQSDMNLHFHGLTVSPNPPGDDVVTTLALPGGTLHYVVKIPTNQEPGLYWYHPHVFPQTDYQVGQAGMSGAIVIDGLEKHLPGLATMKEHVIIVRDTDVSVVQSSERRAKPNDEDSNGNPCGPDAGLQPSLNGAVRPTISIQPGERQFFRVINATGHKNLKLAVDGAPIDLVAVDGYALDVNSGTPPTESLSSFVVPPAARAEFVVTGPASGMSEFRTLCYDSGPTGDPDPENILADLRSNGSGQSSKHSARVAALRVGAPLPHNAFSGPMPAGTIQRTVVLNEDNNGMYINGKMFNMNDGPMFTVHTGTTERWSVVNITKEVHDFHMHQVHFLVQQINGTTIAHPYWQDSAVVPHRIPGVNGSWKPGYLTMLVDFRDPVIKGTFMFHCHILDHEDSGMMAKIQAI
ncbi:MAG TPA: multicopper oxidase domain-containing protein [Candidatus Tumulicola sp.]|jgi:FtsP/CotA-like multicopper oxidase with cupredoxin domain